MPKDARRRCVQYPLTMPFAAAVRRENRCVRATNKYSARTVGKPRHDRVKNGINYGMESSPLIVVRPVRSVHSLPRPSPEIEIKRLTNSRRPIKENQFLLRQLFVIYHVIVSSFRMEAPHPRGVASTSPRKERGTLEGKKDEIFRDATAICDAKMRKTMTAA